jgi:hypothetical protein
VTFASFAVNRLGKILCRKDGVGWGPLRAWRPFVIAQGMLGGISPDSDKKTLARGFDHARRLVRVYSLGNIPDSVYSASPVVKINLEGFKDDNSS